MPEIADILRAQSKRPPREKVETEWFGLALVLSFASAVAGFEYAEMVLEWLK